jgi:hypothetical protein
MVEATPTDASDCSRLIGRRRTPYIPLGGDIGYAKKKRRGSDQAIQAAPQVKLVLTTT